MVGCMKAAHYIWPQSYFVFSIFYHAVMLSFVIHADIKKVTHISHFYMSLCQLKDPVKINVKQWFVMNRMFKIGPFLANFHFGITSFNRRGKRTKNVNKVRKVVPKDASSYARHLKKAHLNDQRTWDTCFFRHLKSFKSPIKKGTVFTWYSL